MKRCPLSRSFSTSSLMRSEEGSCNARPKTHRIARGFSLAEMLVALALFGVFVAIVGIVNYEMFKVQQKWPVNYLTHPEVGGVVARLRRDVLDSLYYPAEFKGYTQSNRMLVIYSLGQDGFAKTIVYDFRKEDEVHRLEFNGTELLGDWVARAVPAFRISGYTLSTGQDAVRLTAMDSGGKLAIDQIFVPRAHQ
ncbi:MAG: prepilin-type N-terminal cleavage/methylation domain-containing protein [Thermoanaerobaculia bacterium]